jgi:putative membrane protein
VNPAASGDARPADNTRDHLANERTFLAWVRTALGLIGLGFVLARMGLFLRQIAMAAMPQNVRGARAGHEFLVSGVIFLLVGTALCGWAGWRYHQASEAIDSGRYEPARNSVIALSVVVVVGGLVIVGLVAWRTLAPDGG